MNLYYEILETPVGLVSILTSEHEVLASSLPGKPDTLSVDSICLSDIYRIQKTASPLRAQVEEFISELFSGTRPNPLPYRLESTPFRQKVWAALLDIQPGQVESYGQVARRIGYPKASRAVGMACRSNPIPLFIPCHRVIGSNGKLTGYGGPNHIDIKQQLLQLESDLFQRNSWKSVNSSCNNKRCQFR
jgi:O-6-methylguanine DNA methyltransferase